MTLGQMCEKKAVLPMIDRLAIEKDPEVLSFVVEAQGNWVRSELLSQYSTFIIQPKLNYLQEVSQIAIQNILKR